MAKSTSETPKKFRPERPIYLNEQNTGLKTRDELDLAIEKLRARGWLVTYGERSRPFHLCFNDVDREFQDFKKDCDQLKVTLKSPNMKTEDFEEELKKDDESNLPPPEPKSTFEDPSGQVHIES